MPLLFLSFPSFFYVYCRRVSLPNKAKSEKHQQSHLQANESVPRCPVLTLLPFALLSLLSNIKIGAGSGRVCERGGRVCSAFKRSGRAELKEKRVAAATAPLSIHPTRPRQSQIRGSLQCAHATAKVSPAGRLSLPLPTPRYNKRATNPSPVPLPPTNRSNDPDPPNIIHVRVSQPKTHGPNPSCPLPHSLYPHSSISGGLVFPFNLFCVFDTKKTGNVTSHVRKQRNKQTNRGPLVSVGEPTTDPCCYTTDCLYRRPRGRS